MRARFIIATDTTDLDEERFSEECLQGIVNETLLPCPISLNFDSEDIIGQMVELEYFPNTVIGTAELKHLAIVPGFAVDPERDIERQTDGTTVIKRCKIFQFGLTFNPADPNAGILLEKVKRKA
ncbi:MAG: hypothetical protein H8D67_30920 [Deltaproteobacteria bacterium]|nr:hypothetical protein [Deltaproteobacteria bacterium]